MSATYAVQLAVSDHGERSELTLFLREAGAPLDSNVCVSAP